MTNDIVIPYTCTVYPEDVVRRFWAKVDVGSEQECWPWGGSKNAITRPDRIVIVGQFYIKGKLVVPHRIAWELFNSEFLGRRVLERSCNNTLCCNPRHASIKTSFANPGKNLYLARPAESYAFIDDFYSMTEIIMPANCWVWTGPLDSCLYGRFRYGNQMYRAPRLSWELANGEELGTRQANHHCDFPPCVNPEHLYAGNDQTNMEDKVRRNRQAKGSNNGRSKLSERDIPIIRNLSRDGGLSNSEIGRMYNVDSAAIRSIIIGKNWRHIE